MAEVVEDHLEDGDEETEDWGWEEVDMLVPGRLKNATIGDGRGSCGRRDMLQS